MRGLSADRGEEPQQAETSKTCVSPCSGPVSYTHLGWAFPWYSSQGSDFNYDFHVTLDESVTPIEYNFRTAQELADMGHAWAARPGEHGGVSVFLRDGDTVLRTWSGYGPVIDLFCETDILLDQMCIRDSP